MNEGKHKLLRAGDGMVNHLDFPKNLVVNGQSLEKLRAKLARASHARTKWRDAKALMLRRNLTSHACNEASRSVDYGV